MTIKPFAVFLAEASGSKGKSVVVTFGRMNPITIGHAKLVKVLSDKAKSLGATPLVALSQSRDAKKNPLTWDQKVHYFEKFFPSVPILKDRSVSNMGKLFEYLQKNGYNRVYLVVGQDRVDEFKAKGVSGVGNGDNKLYGFDHFEIVSAGARNPNATGVEGMSASKLRELVVKNDKTTFSKGVPTTNKAVIDAYFKDIKKGMELK